MAQAHSLAYCRYPRPSCDRSGLLTGVEAAIGLAMTHGHWAIKPATELVVAQRQAIIMAVEDLWTILSRRKYPIVVAGLSGTGKSVLAGYLSGRIQPGHSHLPHRSEKREQGRCMTENGRIAISVWPGQDSPARAQAMRETLKGSKTVGLVYVVSNGLTYLWEPHAQTMWARKGVDSIEKYQKYQRALEVRDFEQVTTSFKQMALDKASWMMVAVTKADLWWDRVADCAEFYEFNEKSPFVKATNDLFGDLGRQGLRLNVRPVCTTLEPFTFAGQRLNVQLGENARNGLLNEFVGALSDLCGSVEELT
jgi:hypothetical protein